MGCGCGNTTAPGTKKPVYKYRTKSGGESARTFGTEADARTALAKTGQRGDTYEVK